MRRRGPETALVEQELVGGECSYWGCIPSKTLIRPGDVLAAARACPARRRRSRARSMPPPRSPARLHDEQLDRRRPARLARDERIEFVRGEGRLDGERMVRGHRQATARRTRSRRRRRWCVATGHADRSSRRSPGSQTLGAWDNRYVTSAKELPPPTARARRRRDRRGDGAGVQAARLRGGHRRRGRAAAARSGRAVRGRRGARRLRGRGHRGRPAPS